MLSSAKEFLSPGVKLSCSCKPCWSLEIREVGRAASRVAGQEITSSCNLKMEILCSLGGKHCWILCVFHTFGQIHHQTLVIFSECTCNLQLLIYSSRLERHRALCSRSAIKRSSGILSYSVWLCMPLKQPWGTWLGILWSVFSCYLPTVCAN